ncbi:hypothetical protein [Aliarcobacter cryaerophilus]|uniref:hypothetical protein n=1 Tax=Aliarcobacter cryaerophilus TaxID=28198 RepID=UPI003DA5FBE3
MAQITKNLKLGTILKAIKIEEHAPFELGKFYKITDGDFVGSYTINNHIAYRYSINEIGDYFELIDSLEDIENLEYKASILKETLEQYKIMLGDDISDDEILKEAIEFLVNNENSDEIELQFICDNMDIAMVEKCSCCGDILLPDDECYSDSLNDGATLCDHCSIYNEETDMYEKYLNQDVIEKITGLKFSSHIGNVGSKIEEFNQFIKENKFKFSILEKDEINSTTFLSFMSERTDWNTCDCCGLVEVSTDLIWDSDEVYDEDYQNFRFLRATSIPSDAFCKGCLDLAGQIAKPSLETITSRKKQNNLTFRVGETVLLENVEWFDKPRVSNYIAKIVSLDETKKTYTLEEYGDVEFKEDEFYDVVNEAYLVEYADFIANNYLDLSSEVDDWVTPNYEGIAEIDYAFKEFGYKNEFIEYLKAKNLPYGRFLEPKFKIGDKFKVHFDYYEKGETTEHIIAKIDTSFTEADEVVYWSDDQVYITESELIKQTSNYVVWAIYANNLEFYKNGMTKNEAEMLYIKLCKKNYREDGLENFKEFLGVEELSISQYHEYYQSEQYLDSGDLSHVSLEQI